MSAVPPAVVAARAIGMEPAAETDSPSSMQTPSSTVGRASPSAQAGAVGSPVPVAMGQESPVIVGPTVLSVPKAVGAAESALPEVAADGSPVRAGAAAAVAAPTITVSIADAVSAPSTELVSPPRSYPDLLELQYFPVPAATSVYSTCKYTDGQGIEKLVVGCGSSIYELGSAGPLLELGPALSFGRNISSVHAFWSYTQHSPVVVAVCESTPDAAALYLFGAHSSHVKSVEAIASDQQFLELSYAALHVTHVDVLVGDELRHVLLVCGNDARVHAYLVQPHDEQLREVALSWVLPELHLLGRVVCWISVKFASGCCYLMAGCQDGYLHRSVRQSDAARKGCVAILTPSLLQDSSSSSAAAAPVSADATGMTARKTATSKKHKGKVHRRAASHRADSGLAGYARPPEGNSVAPNLTWFDDVSDDNVDQDEFGLGSLPTKYRPQLSSASHPGRYFEGPVLCVAQFLVLPPQSASVAGPPAGLVSSPRAAAAGAHSSFDDPPADPPSVTATPERRPALRPQLSADDSDVRRQLAFSAAPYLPLDAMEPDELRLLYDELCELVTTHSTLRLPAPQMQAVVAGGIGFAAVLSNLDGKHLVSRLLPATASSDSVLCVAVCETTPTGEPELLIGTYDRRLLAYQYDSASGNYRRSWQQRFAHPVHSISVGDFNLDGLDEIVVTTLFGVHVLQPSMSAAAAHVLSGASQLAELSHLAEGVRNAHPKPA